MGGAGDPSWGCRRWVHGGRTEGMDATLGKGHPIPPALVSVLPLGAKPGCRAEGTQTYSPPGATGLHLGKGP